MEKTKITFKQESESYIAVMRGGKQIGHIYSQTGDGTTPYPHNKTVYCLNSVQICGFDRISEVWGCGPFHGKKDVVVHFMSSEEEEKKLKGYETYVKNKINKKETTSIQNFNDWCKHNF